MGCQAQKQEAPAETVAAEPVVDEKPTAPPKIEVSDEMKINFLKEAGFEGGVVVESLHPYEAEPNAWSQRVEVPGAAELAVYFAPKSCTFDVGTCIRVSVGGLDRTTAGPGGRMEFEVNGGGQIRCTIIEFDRDSGLRKVLLDRREQKVVQSAKIQVGDRVEAQRDGEWCAATVEEIMETREWYYAKRAPSQCRISWLDGEQQDDRKELSELRQQTAVGRCLEDLPGAVPRYGHVLDIHRNSFAAVSDEPQACWVDYTGMAVGDEITEFALDTSFPLTPIMVKGFAPNSDSGPAQSSGVQTGWFLDLLGMESADSGCWTGLLQALDGLGGLSLPPSDGASEPEVPDGHISKLLDAALNSPQELLQRLNQALMTKEAKLLFTNSSSPRPAELLGEAKIKYPKGLHVGSEIKTFTKGPEGVKVLEFSAEGPAQVAGVGTDWTLDLQRTLASVRQQDAAFTPQLLQGNPNRLLSLSDVTLTFMLKRRGLSQMFEASGPPDAPEPSLLTCLKPSEVPYSTDKWLTAGADTLKKTTGKYYHEVKLDEISSTPQIGWLADSLEPGNFDNKGVGDDEHGWAVDGVRGLNWHKGSSFATWPRDWQQGDVIGFALDLDGGEMKCSMNGQWVDATVTTFKPNGRALYPAVSLKGLYTLNIVPQTWVHQPPDDSYTAWADTGSYTRPLVERWKCPMLPGKSATFEFRSDGGGADMPQKRWGVWALVLPETSRAPTEEELKTLAAKWTGEQN